MAMSRKLYGIHRDYWITIKIDADALISSGGGGPVPGSAGIQHNRIHM